LFETFGYSIPVFLALAVVSLGSIGAVIDFAAGRAISAKDLEVSFTLKNWSFSPVEIVGVSSSCNCVFNFDFPRSFQPFEKKELKFTVIGPNPDQNVVQHERLYLRVNGDDGISNFILDSTILFVENECRIEAK
jgi:hypothetical protein